MFYKIKMWILRKFFPKRYCKCVGKQAAKRLMDSFDRLNIAMKSFSNAFEEFKNKGRELEPKTNADRIREMSDEELAETVMCPNDSGRKLGDEE